MTTAWRLVKARYADGAFTGNGARLAGGRWNRPGTPVVYVSETLSLAVLELFVHLPPGARRTLRLVSVPVRIPEELIAEPPELPEGWRREPPPAATQELGTAWAESGTSCVLRVPSAIVPVDSNLVLNPAHPAFAAIELGEPEPFSLDPRLWR